MEHEVRDREEARTAAKCDRKHAAFAVILAVSCLLFGAELGGVMGRERLDGVLSSLVDAVQQPKQAFESVLPKERPEAEPMGVVRARRTSVRKAQGHFLSARFWHASYLMDLFELTAATTIAPPNHSWTGCGADVDVLVAWSGNSVRHLESGLECHTNASILHIIGDERCNTPQLFEAFSKFRLVTREFACGQQYKDLYRRHVNVLNIPLAYATGMFGCSPLLQTPGYEPRCSGGTSSLDIVTQVLHEVRFGKYRPYVWSFMGTIKEDRQLALDTFNSLTPNYVYIERANIFGKQHYLNNHSDLVVMGGK